MSEPRVNPNGTLKGKVAVVTGASRGIGEAIGARLAMEGAKVRVSGVEVIAAAADGAGDAAPSELSERGEANLIALTRLAGYVKYFHPSDQAAEASWPEFLVLAVERVEVMAAWVAVVIKLPRTLLPGRATPVRSLREPNPKARPRNLVKPSPRTAAVSRRCRRRMRSTSSISMKRKHILPSV